MTEFFPTTHAFALDDFSLSKDYNGQQKHSAAIRDRITTLDDATRMVVVVSGGRRRGAIVTFNSESPPTYRQGLDCRDNDNFS